MLQRRRVVAYGLMLLFTAIPYLKVGAKPFILLDIPARRFIIFGATFLPTDTVLLMLLMVGIVVGIFLITALSGRIWCGWACPQTVYMEFLFRPIERLFEGGPASQRKLDRSGGGLRRLSKNLVFFAVTLFVAHTFLAYFVGIERLARWVTQSPFEHPAAFVVMASVTVLMFVDFAWFREQTCIVACPYGRLQSVLLDTKSLIVGYDRGRGEPRRKPKDRRQDTPSGDCIDCYACVATCPTGIDIRDGLQMECIHCTQCIDACDAIMDRLGKPRGLIRYSSQDELSGHKRRFLRPRVVAYPALLALVIGAFTFALAGREAAEVTILRGGGSPFVLTADGQVSNQLTLKISNRTDTSASYRISLAKSSPARLVVPTNPLTVPPNRTGSSPVFLIMPRPRLSKGDAFVEVRVESPGFAYKKRVRFVGPSGSS